MSKRWEDPAVSVSGIGNLFTDPPFEGPLCVRAGYCKDCNEWCSLLGTRICLTCHDKYELVHKASDQLKRQEPPVFVTAAVLHAAAQRKSGKKKEVSDEAVLGHTLFIWFVGLLGLAYALVYGWL